jgi:FkbM family methyltransferase
MHTKQPPLSERLLVSYARRFPFRKGKLRVVDKFWRRAADGMGTQRLARLKYGQFSVRCDISEMLQRQFYFFGTYFLEEEIIDCWRREAKGTSVIFDVGANAGIYSLAALASDPNVAVYAFEPTPEIESKLRQNAELNKLDNLHVLGFAVSNVNGYARLIRYGGERGANGGMNFIAEEGENDASDRVRTVRLDDFCDNHGISSIDLLKVDVQGHEHEVLTGAEQLLRTGRIRTIFLELNWRSSPGQHCPATESIQLLTRFGYRFAVPGRSLTWKKPGGWMANLSDIVARNKLRSD